jgi:hypothetical protein
MKYVIVALILAFSATAADAHNHARHHAGYKHRPPGPPVYPEAYAAPDSLGIAGDVGVVYIWDACNWVWSERRCW